MNILNLITGNWFRGPQTQRYPDRQPPAVDYRGRVRLDPDTCRTCSVCARVCVSAAITFEPIEGARFEWAYDPARCTFCGVCVAYCPVKSLTQESDRGPSCSRPGEQAETIVVAVKRRAKKSAGKPAVKAAVSDSDGAERIEDGR